MIRSNSFLLIITYVLTLFSPVSLWKCTIEWGFYALLWFVRNHSLRIQRDSGWLVCMEKGIAERSRIKGNNIWIWGCIYFLNHEVLKINTENITVDTQSSIRIAGSRILYFDPFQIANAVHDADLVFVTHSHYDHLDPESIAKITGENAVKL